jgi:leucyl aminopeptidase
LPLAEEAPEMVFDFATLTGAARVALGPDLPPFYTMDEELAADIKRLGASTQDPVWRLPLWEPYDKFLESKIADLNNISGSPLAGSIIAALFLRRFVQQTKSWAHSDIYAWTPKAKTRPPRRCGNPGRTAALRVDRRAISKSRRLAKERTPFETHERRSRQC